MSVFCATVLKIHLFGGACDGAEIDVENWSEKITIGPNQYADSFYMDKKGCSVYYCARGPGRMRKSYVDKLFGGENIF